MCLVDERHWIIDLLQTLHNQLINLFIVVEHQKILSKFGALNVLLVVFIFRFILLREEVVLLNL
jgi:hypothetical protein